MSDFVFDGTPLPTGKVDAGPIAVAADRAVTASEWNAVMAAIADLRAAVLAGQYHGLSSAPAAPVAPAGGVRLRSNGGLAEVSHDGGAYSMLLTGANHWTGPQHVEYAYGSDGSIVYGSPPWAS